MSISNICKILVCEYSLIIIRNFYMILWVKKRVPWCGWMFCVHLFPQQFLDPFFFCSSCLAEKQKWPCIKVPTCVSYLYVVFCEFWTCTYPQSCKEITKPQTNSTIYQQVHTYYFRTLFHSGTLNLNSQTPYLVGTISQVVSLSLCIILG